MIEKALVGIAAEVLFRVARRRVRHLRLGAAGANPATFDPDAYQRWRARELASQLARHFDIDFGGRDVLDFGCGIGALSWMVAAMGARSVTGIDMAAPLIDVARRHTGGTVRPVHPRFIVARSPTLIDLPSASIDVILCFDTLEHVFHHETVMQEWRRVLRQDGRIFIWWCPWYHPYGHHIESLVPLPWAHVFFPERMLTETCARIYDLPEFSPRIWDTDATGRKKPNKWWAMSELPDVNRLTLAGFERSCRRVGFRVMRRERTGFAGSPAARLTGVLTRVPALREFFTASVAYDLQRI